MASKSTKAPKKAAPKKVDILNLTEDEVDAKDGDRDQLNFLDPEDVNPYHDAAPITCDLLKSILIELWEVRRILQKAGR